MIGLMILAGMMALPTFSTGQLRPNFPAKMNEGGSAATKVRLVVSADGTPIECDVVFSNGPRTNGEALCGQLRREAHFMPAKDGRGEPTAGVVTLWSSWESGRWSGDKAPDWDPVDQPLELAQLPKGIAEMTAVLLLLRTDASGIVQECAITAPRASGDTASFLCAAAGKVVLPPVIGSDERRIEAVRPYRVRIASTRFMDQVMNRIKRPN